MVEIFLRSLLIGYSGAIMPGSLFTYTIDKSMKHGAKSGLLISIGHSILEFFIVILLLFGLAKFLSTKLTGAIIGIAGGIILICLAICMMRDAYLNRLNLSVREDGKNVRSYGNMLFAGAFISALNPGFIFWWAVIGLGLTMSAYTAFGIKGVVAFYIGHILADISWYCFLSTLISKTRSFISMKLYKGIVYALALFLIAMGLSFIYNGARYFITL